MIAAGVEGGSKRAIEEDWHLDDVENQYGYWKRNGPPLNVAAISIAAALGVKLISDAPPDDIDIETLDVTPGTPALAELAGAFPLPVAGGDTVAASRAALEKLKELRGNG